MLSPIERAIILLLHQYATREFGLKMSDICTKLSIARVTVERCHKKYKDIIKVCPTPRYPLHLYADNTILVERAPELGLVGENVLKRQVDLVQGSVEIENRIDYTTHFGVVPTEQPVSILTQGIEELIASLKKNTPTALEMLEHLPHALESAFEAVSTNDVAREEHMQMAWNALEDARAVAATYLKVCEIYMFDPRMCTPEYWAVFMHRIAGFHTPVTKTVFTETPQGVNGDSDGSMATEG